MPTAVFSLRHALVGMFVCVLTAAACAPTLQTIREKVVTSPYQKVLVVTFAPHSEHPTSGDHAAETLIQKLRELGFNNVDRHYAKSLMDVIRLERDERNDQNDQLEVARKVGVGCIIEGEVTEFGQSAADPSSSPQPVATPPLETVSAQLLTWNTAPQTVVRFGAKVKMTDAVTGEVVWSGGLADGFRNSTIQNVSSSVLGRLAREIGLLVYNREATARAD